MMLHMVSACHCSHNKRSSTVASKGCSCHPLNFYRLYNMICQISTTVSDILSFLS